MGGHNHTRAAAEGTVIGFAVFVGGIVTDIMREYRDKSFLLSNPENSGVEGLGEHLREDGEYIDSQHGILLSVRVCADKPIFLIIIGIRLSM